MLKLLSRSKSLIGPFCQKYHGMEFLHRVMGQSDQLLGLMMSEECARIAIRVDGRVKGTYIPLSTDIQQKKTSVYIITLELWITNLCSVSTAFLNVLITFSQWLSVRPKFSWKMIVKPYLSLVGLCNTFVPMPILIGLSFPLYLHSFLLLGFPLFLISALQQRRSHIPM